LAVDLNRGLLLDGLGVGEGEEWIVADREKRAME
jgi:hypothetical protein